MGINISSTETLGRNCKVTLVDTITSGARSSHGSSLSNLGISAHVVIQGVERKGARCFRGWNLAVGKKTRSREASLFSSWRVVVAEAEAERTPWHLNYDMI